MLIELSNDFVIQRVCVRKCVCMGIISLASESSLFRFIGNLGVVSTFLSHYAIVYENHL